MQRGEVWFAATPGGVVIRPAVERDLAGIAEVGAITWPATYQHFAGEQYVRENLSAYWTLDALHQTLADHLVLLVAEGEGRVIGVVEIGAHHGVPTMWRLYVLPEMHGHGVGTALLNAAIDALPAGSSELVTEYTAGNDPTGRWYAARGFTETHRDPRPGGLDVVWMSLLLKEQGSATDR